LPAPSYKAYRGVTVIKAPIAKIQALQEDRGRGLLDTSASHKVLKRGQGWTCPVQGTVPGDRDSILEITVRTADGTVTPLLWKCRPISRSQRHAGSAGQRLSPKATTRPEVTYQVHTEPAAACLRGWPTSSVDAPFNTLKALKGALKNNAVDQVPPALSGTFGEPSRSR
jgi:hypothetical protein